MRIRDLIKTSMYIGVTGYGGPAILAHMKQIIVKKKQWVTEQEFMEGLSLSQMLPGATGVNLMGYIGFRLKSYLGATVMAVGFALPAFIFITVLSWAYFQFGELSFVKSLFIGLGALVIALLFNALKTMGNAVFPKLNHLSVSSIIIVTLNFLGIFFLHTNIIYLLLISGLLGLTTYFLDKFSDSSNKKGISDKSLSTPLKNISQPLRFGNATIPLITLLLFIFIMLVSPSRDLFFGFVKVGLLAFGGGFTSIPLMQQIIVSGHHWLSLTQFRDGIAMGQITPGPVLITAAFVGYKVQGMWGALTATTAIFLPSFLGIILLSSVHKQFGEQKIVKSVLKGLSAAFIGLILAVTLTMALKSLINWQTWGIFLVSVIVLLIYKKDPLWAILGTIIISLIIL